jgi:hypothetical protein
MLGALRQLYTGRFLLWRPIDVPGGRRTVAALVARGLIERNGGYINITDAGVRTLEGRR